MVQKIQLCFHLLFCPRFRYYITLTRGKRKPATLDGTAARNDNPGLGGTGGGAQGLDLLDELNVLNDLTCRLISAKPDVYI